MLNERFLVLNGILLPDEQDREALLTLLERDMLRRMDARRELGLDADEGALERELAAELRRHRERVLWVFRRRDLDVPIEEMDLSVRAYNTLRRGGICTVGGILERPRQEIRALRNMGEKGFRSVLDALGSFAVKRLGEEWHREGTGIG